MPERGIALGITSQHSGDFLDPGFVLQLNQPSRDVAGLLGLLDPEMHIGARRDLSILN